MSASEKYDPAWSTVHNAHGQRRRVRVDGDGVQVVGHVVEIKTFDGEEFFTVRADGGTEVPFRFGHVTVDFAGEVH